MHSSYQCENVKADTRLKILVYSEIQRDFVILMCMTHIVFVNIHLKKCTLSVSVGVNGTVNGRSASSPTGNSAVSNSSLPAKGNKEKTKANCSRSQKSSQDKGQLHQKTIQKIKEKVNVLQYTA